MNCLQVINKLKSLADPDYLAGMADFGINTNRALGVSAPLMRKLAKEIWNIDSPSARWITADALRELTSKKVHTRLRA
jgi:3-methyladenine DNA glycosylase AlkD